VAKFRKKPVVVEAIRVMAWDLDSIAAWCSGEAVRTINKHAQGITIQTLEGAMRADLGDYIIRGVNGEFYPCKPDIFEKTYDLVD